MNAFSAYRSSRIPFTAMYSAPSTRNSTMNLFSGVRMKRSLSISGSGSFSSSSWTRSALRSVRKSTSRSSVVSLRAHRAAALGSSRDPDRAARSQGSARDGSNSPSRQASRSSRILNCSADASPTSGAASASPTSRIVR